MNKATFTPGDDKKSMVIERDFNAPVEKVWEAWTTQELLEQWWAPKPWKAITKEFNFSEGGHWLYAMTGPEGDQHWGLEKYLKINHQKDFSADDCFCDEDGNPTPGMPTNRWEVEFKDEDGKTHLIVRMVTPSEQDLKKLSEMGFKEGFSQGLDQLEELLKE